MKQASKIQGLLNRANQRHADKKTGLKWVRVPKKYLHKSDNQMQVVCIDANNIQSSCFLTYNKFEDYVNTVLK